MSHEPHALPTTDLDTFRRQHASQVVNVGLLMCFDVGEAPARIPDLRHMLACCSFRMGLSFRPDCGLAGRCAAEVLLRFSRDSAAALLGVQSATLTTLRTQIPHDHAMLRVSKGWT